MQEIDVFYLFQYYNFPIRRVGSSYRSNICPACGESSKKSNKVILNERYWFCFRCCSHGNGYEFIKKLENVDFKEALEIWNRIIGNDYSPPEKIINFKKIVKHKSEEEITEELKLKQKLIYKILNYIVEDYEKTDGYKYLINCRKINSKIIKKYINQTFFIINTQKILSDKEILNLAEKLEIKFKIFTSRELIFPFYDEKGNILGAEFRTVNPEPNYPKTISLGKQYPQIWQGKFKNILIVEGFVDGLTALSMDWKGDLLILPGVSHAKRAAKILKEMKYKKVFIGLDPDEAGIKASLEIKKIIKARELNLPSEKDLNELFKNGELNKIYDILPESFWEKIKKKLKIA